MMPTDLASVAPAGRERMAPEADLASVVEARWYERSPRPNHCTLPGAETSAHAAVEGLTAHPTVKSGRASGRDAEHNYRTQRNKRFAYHVLLLQLQCLDAFAHPSLDWIRFSSRWTNRRRPTNQVAGSRVRSPAHDNLELQMSQFLTCKSACWAPFSRGGPIKAG
jgi:hypothetical protein